MKLVVFGPQKRLGALLEDGSVVDLNYAYAASLSARGVARPYAAADAEVPSCMASFIEEGDAGLKAAKKAVDYAKKNKAGTKGEMLVVSGAVLHAPLPSLASRVVMAGANFYDHSAAAAKMGGRATTVEDMKKQVADGTYAAWGFWKEARNVVGPNAQVQYPARTQRLDYECEIGAVIGKKGKDVKEADGEGYIYGYTIVNDLSIRDGRGVPGTADGIMWGKNFDGCAPMGPCIVTKDEIKDVYKLKLVQKVSGQVRQNGSMEEMIRKYPWWIQWITRDQYIYPGDIVCGGTCAGTAMDTTPRIDGKTAPDKFLKVGDVLEATVEPIGTLKTTIVAKK